MRKISYLVLIVMFFKLSNVQAGTCREIIHKDLGVQLDCEDWVCTATDQRKWSGLWYCGNDKFVWTTDCPACESGKSSNEGLNFKLWIIVLKMLLQIK